MKPIKVTDQKLSWNEKTNQTTLLTQYEDGTILSEPLTSEEASKWTAMHKY
jgi:hypothetical protein